MIVAIIPARLASTRLPNKLILADTGKPLLHHTLDRVQESKLADLTFVVTPDQTIIDVVSQYNNPKVSAVLTGAAESGTERIAKFCTTYFANDDHIIVNFQGDEPNLAGKYIDQLATEMATDIWDVVTLASPITKTEAENRNVVKVVMTHNQQALLFSRQSIPFGGPWYKHVGIYAYRTSFLRKLFVMPPTTIKSEKLEQLQWLQAGCRIKVLIDVVKSVGIDSPSDYAKFVASYNGDQDADQIQ